MSINILEQTKLAELFKEAEKFFLQTKYEESEKILLNILHEIHDQQDALHNLATIYFAQNKKKEAVILLKKVLLINPELYNIHYHCAIALSELDELDEAIFHCNESIRINKNYIDPYLHLAKIFEFQKKSKEVIKTYKKLIEFNPGDIQAYLLLSDFYSREGKQHEAIQVSYELDNIRKNIPEVYFNLGTYFSYLKNYEKSIEKFLEAIKLRPGYAEAHGNLGDIYARKGLFLKSELHANLALKFADYNSYFYFEQKNNLGFFRLRLGKYQSGWQDYDFRLKLKNNSLCRYNLNPNSWKKIQANSSILVLSEQGIGDTIYLSRFFKSLADLSSELSVQIDARLLNIFERTFSEIKFLDKDKEININDFKYQIPIASIPSLFIKSKKDFSKIYPQNLIPNKSIKIKTKYKILVGISWRSSSPGLGEDASIELENFLKIFDGLQVSIINLQYGELSEHEKNIILSFGNIEFINYQIIDNFNDIDGLLSLIDCCDYVVTIDNITLHLASSTNKLTYGLLPIFSDFRWGVNDDKHDLYPSLKLIRSKKVNDWSEVINITNMALKK